ncbi:MAG: hypothetical protein FJ333_11450 [Sphingomonadales bacterium]|nr:hypothetical protein [Sphingomonadales bacterium]
MDIKKAFDCVDHNILFKKLDNLGIKNNKLDWFKSYLCNRSQKVDINGKISESKNISIGVLQGSSLGPLLFLCFINDMPRSSLFFSLLFADDTACLAAHSDIDVLYNMVNVELQKIACWFKTNKLSVNVSKTKYIHFHYKHKRVDLTNYKVYYNDNEPGNVQDQTRIFELSRIYDANPNFEDKYYKYLGILVDESLTFNAHLSYISTKLCRSLYILNKAKNTLPKSTLKNVYFALIHPHLLYCMSITACTTKKNIDKLYKAQKKAIKIINNNPNNKSSKEIFKNMRILPFPQIAKLQQLLFMHSVYYEYCPRSFVNNFALKREGRHDHDLRNLNNFNLPFPRSESFKRLPPYSFIQNWNDLEESKLYANRYTFKNSVTENMLNDLYA